MTVDGMAPIDEVTRPIAEVVDKAAVQSAFWRSERSVEASTERLEKHLRR